MKKTVGRAKCGIARNKALAPKRRSAIAKKAAAARWSDEVRTATHGSDDHPLTIGGIEIPCYVLEDDTRVLSQRGLQIGIGMSKSGGTTGAHRLAQQIGKKLPRFRLPRRRYRGVDFMSPGPNQLHRIKILNGKVNEVEVIVELLPVLLTGS
jgi:hypothetical protein